VIVRYKAEYEAKVARRFGLEQQLELPISKPEFEESDLSRAARALAWTDDNGKKAAN
jgi:hypothetical protein